MLSGVIVVLLISISFVAGFITRGEQDSASAQSESEPEFHLLKQVDQLIGEHYVYEIPEETTLEYAAIRGYLGALNDRYTFFNDPPVASSESDALAGRYGGVGVNITRNEVGEVQLFPYPDSPALQAGVMEGDILIRVNGIPLAPGERLDVIRQMLRGEIIEGEFSGVQITVRQPGQDTERNYDIPFAEIRVPSVLSRMLDEELPLGYVHILRFTSLTPDELREAIASLQAEGMQGLVLDLRDNSGGLLQESIDIAGEFLDGEVIFREKTRAEGEVVTEDDLGGVLTELPMVVITNNRTGSAAEIVAGALKDNDRALVIGQQTLGKGSVQFIFPLEDGSSIHITTAVWFTPNNDPIDNVGLVPDIAMIPDENGRDVELGEAIRQLQTAIVTNASQ